MIETASSRPGRTAPGSPGPATRIGEVERRSVLIHSDPGLGFHNWRHVQFVRDHAVEFAQHTGGDPDLVALAALTHDFNYAVAPASGVGVGAELRGTVLRQCGVDEYTIYVVEEIVQAAHIGARPDNPGPEVRALHDADVLFKILPITPVVFAPAYMQENTVAIEDLAAQIVAEQGERLRDGTLFYDRELLERFRPWAEANLELWALIGPAMERMPALGELVAAAGLPRRSR